MPSDLIRGVETGSRQENASNQESRAPFRFYRYGKALASRLILPVAMMPVAMVPMAMMPVVMTPMPVMPVPVIAPMMMVVAPVHFGGHLPGVILNRGGGAGTGQR